MYLYECKTVCVYSMYVCLYECSFVCKIYIMENTFFSCGVLFHHIKLTRASNASGRRAAFASLFQ